MMRWPARGMLAAALLLGAGCSDRRELPADAGGHDATAEAGRDAAGVDADMAPDGGGQLCRLQSSDCSPPALCDVRSCTPGVLGYCTVLPAACPDTLDPVCGCDGNSYANDCMRVRAGVGRSSAGPCSAVNDGGICLDSDLEPNDTPETATSLDSSLVNKPGVSLYGLEICSAADVDYYSFTLDSPKTASLTVQFQRDQGELAASLLDSSLSPGAVGAPLPSGLRCEAALGAGLYYIKIEAGPGGTVNTYDLSLGLQ